jgi:adenylate cyclase class IV
MEVEMKAQISVAQAKELVDGNIGEYHITRGGGWRPFHRRDTYYSFNGEKLNRPTNIIRIREEAEIGDDSFEDIILGKATKFKDGTNKTFLTVKAKNTDEKGVETNEETEGILVGDAKAAFEKSMKICNFKPYFQKRKDSVSLYVAHRNEYREMHCEIVNVNGHGPYLEVEVIVPDVKNKDSSMFDNPADAKNIIEGFFYDVFGITKFDGRSWAEIIEEN